MARKIFLYFLFVQSAGGRAPNLSRTPSLTLAPAPQVHQVPAGVEDQPVAFARKLGLAVAVPIVARLEFHP